MLLEEVAARLASLQLIEAPSLAGGKIGVICGHKAYVSPAMMSLIRTEGPDLTAVLSAIEWKEFPAGFFDPPSLDGWMHHDR